MIHYINKQRNHFSCAPVAILNALKWRDGNVTYDTHYKSIARECKTDRDGTDTDDFLDALANYQFELTETRMLTDVRNHLREGGAAIISYIDKEDEWHYSFWHAYRFGRFHGANIEFSTDERSVTDKVMRRYLLKTNEDDDLPSALLLSTQPQQ